MEVQKSVSRKRGLIYREMLRNTVNSYEDFMSWKIYVIVFTILKFV